MNQMFTLPFRPAYDSNGRFAPGAQAWFTLTETNTPTPVYTDAALTIPHENPIIADGLGKFPRAYLDPAVTYRCRVYVKDALVGIDDPLTDHDYDPYTGTEQGSQGIPGSSALILDPVVITTTLAAGSPAAASAVDLGGHVYQLHLGIPQGAPGSSGALNNGDYGDIVVGGVPAGTILTIDAKAVTLAKMADLPAGTFIGNDTGALGPPKALTAAEMQAALGIPSPTRVYSVFVPAAAMKPRPTGGATIGSFETLTNKVGYDTLDFDQTTSEFAQFGWAPPKSWNEGTLTAQFIWTSNNTGTCRWSLQGLAYSDAEVLDAAFGAAVTVDDTAAAAATVLLSPFTGAMTIGGTPSENDMLTFQVSRVGGSGTLAADARLLGIRLNFTVNAGTDA